MNRTTIPWVRNEDGTQGFTWNPITGCTKGCDYCYARAFAHRFGCSGKCEQRDGVVEATAESMPFPAGFAPTTYPHRLDEPLRREKPATIFLGSMGDLFDPAFPDEFRDRVFSTIAATPQHTYLLLTKQAEEMQRYLAECDELGCLLQNLWAGVSVTNQQDADARVARLLATPAAHIFVSVEPMLGPVDFRVPGPLGRFTHTYDSLKGWHIHHDDGDVWTADIPKLDLVVVGGKTPGKPLHELEDTCSEYRKPGECASCGNANDTYQDCWLRSLRDQCAESGVPFFYKHGKLTPELDGVVHDELPWVVTS